MLPFLKQAILHPKSTGAIAQSSKRLIDATINSAKLDSARAIVEFGPGSGAVTKEILRNLPKNALFFTIEKNPDFAKLTKKNCPGVIVYEDSASNIKKYLNIHKSKACDRIFSELPWASFEEWQRDAILNAAHAALDKGGIFLTSAYIPCVYFSKGKIFGKKLKNYFSKISKTKIIWRNLPPAFIYVCIKQ